MTGRSSSILSRILWLHAAALLVTAIIVASAVYLFVDSTADRLQRQTLLGHAEAIANGLSQSEGEVRLPSEVISRFAGSGASFSYIIIDRGGRPLASRGDVEEALIRAPRERATTYFRESSRRAVLSGVSLPATSGNRPCWIVVIQNLEHPDVIVDDIARQFLLGGGILIALILLLLLLVDVVIVRRALRPVHMASLHVRNLDVHDLNVRLPADGMPSEIRPLVLAVNQALDRVAAGYHIQRDFIADAAHALRTPLAIARARAGTIGDETSIALDADLQAMGRIVSQLLDIAAADNAESPLRKTANLSAIAAETVAEIAPLAVASGQMIALAGGEEPILVRGCPELIGRALHALVENALQHTPAGTEITVALSPEGIITVADTGPGIAPADRPHIFRRFWRANPSLPGHSGLGLAIAAQVANAHGTQIDHVSSPAGGATFRIAFQLTPPQTQP